MSEIVRLATTADFFPDLEVDYLDLLEVPYKVGGRLGGSGIDCIGVVLEIYRRAGLGLPDPAREGSSIFDFAALFEPVPAADQLYDLVNIRRESNHVGVLVRPGVVVSAKAIVGTYTARLNAIRAIAGVEFFRVRDASLPT